MLVARDGGARCSWWIVLGLGLAALGCTSGHASGEQPAPALEELDPACAAVPAERLPVITTLVTRDHEVTVHASDDGLRFSVALADGALLGRQLSAHEFEQSFPALHRRFDATFAGDSQWLDASLDGLPTPQPASRGQGPRP